MFFPKPLVLVVSLHIMYSIRPSNLPTYLILFAQLYSSIKKVPFLKPIVSCNITMEGTIQFYS